MAKSDVLVRMKADVSNYDANIAKARRGLEQFRDKNATLGGVMQQGIGILTKYAGAAAALGAAMEGAKKIIASSQTTTDAWGRSMEAATSVSNRFFEAISQGSFDSFISGLKDIIQNARDAYDALDQLATFDAFNNMTTSGFGKRRAELRANIRSGIDVEESKKALKTLERDEQAYYKHSAEVAKEAARARLVEYTGTQRGSGLLTPYVQMGDAGQAAARKAAAQLKQQYGEERTMMSGAKNYVFVDKAIESQYNALIKYAELSDEKAKEISDLFARANAAETQYFTGVASDARLMNARSGGSGGGGRSGGGGSGRTFSSSMNLEDLGVQTIATTTSMKELQNQLSRYKEQLATATNQFDYNAAQQGIEQTQKRIDAQPMAVQMGIDVDTAVHLTEQWEELRAQLQEQMNNDALNLKVDLDANSSGAVKNVEGIAKAATNASKAVSVIGQAFNAIEDPAAKVAATVAQAIASVALAYADAMAKDQTQKFNIFGFIAASAAAMISMATTIAAIHKQTGYALGGVVGGNSYSGDNVGPVMLDAGEVVLNRAQTYALASQLQSNEQGGNSFTTVSGEQLVIAINNYGRRRGMGELIRI